MNLKRILAFTMALACIVPISATIMNNESSIISTYAETDGDFQFTTIGSTGNATIDGYLGSDTDIIIPSTVTDEDGITYTVTELQDDLFVDNVKIKSVTLPNTITYLGYNSFKGCTALETVTFEDNSLIETIGIHTFEGCTNLTTINLPESLKKIDTMAFYGCTSLKTIDLPTNLENISQEAFSNSGLTSLFIPDSIVFIGYSAFKDCTSLKSLTIEDGCKTSFDTSCFEGCTALKTVDLGTTIESLSDNIFKGCSSLTSIDIPKYVDYIPESAFQDCTSLTTVNFSDAVTEIWSYAFANCTSLKDVTLPPNINYITKFAFANCDSITHIDIPATSTSVYIRTGAFAGCNSMYYITIPQDGSFESSVSFDDYALGYDYSKIEDDELVNPTLMENFTIVGVVGSQSETYATENDIPFIDIESGELPEPPKQPDTPTKNNFVNGVFCDVNGDGVANIIDLLIMKKTILGM